MSDRELLEKAALAAGYKRTRYADNGMFQVHHWHEGYEADWEYWDAEDDDGDALRLAVKLHFRIDIHGSEVWVTNMQGNTSVQLAGSDLQAATRRAIVRAAASIGERKGG